MNTKFCFIDLETSGLDPLKDKILEVGCVITDGKLNEIETYSAVPQVDISTLSMDEWCMSTHTGSGLLAEVKNSPKTLDDISMDLIKLLRRHFPTMRPAIGGNSIHFDKSFIKVHLPEVDKKCHYRNIDVSSFMLAISMYHGFTVPRQRQETVHRVMPDIRDSIHYLKSYLDKFDVAKA